MMKAGIDCGTRNIKPHSFRHTLNTILRDEGQDSAKIRATMGWSQKETQDSYTHWQIEHLSGQTKIVDRLFKEQK